MLQHHRMQDEIEDIASPFAEKGYTRERLLHELRDEGTLSRLAIETAAQFPSEIAPATVELLERAQAEDLDHPSARLLYRALHILGAARYQAIYRPLVAFLRSPPDKVGVLGDAITESLSKILAGVFDGDAVPLLALIRDNEADEWVRNAAFGALAFLTFDGRIGRETTEEFLRSFDRESAAPWDNVAWYGWMKAVGLLGLSDLSPRVRAAFRKGRIPVDIADEDYFRDLLKAALRHPDEAERFQDERLGYIDHLLGELNPVRAGHEDGELDPPSAGTGLDPALAEEMDEIVERMAQRALAATPVSNRWRDVGRNDPCPCGSGKKFKKCCLPRSFEPVDQ